MPIALITGITGQDGSYLTEFLLAKGYTVHGIVRRASLVRRPRIDHLTCDGDVYGKTLHLHYADLDDTTTIRRLISKIGPDEIYHLAGQSHVGVSFEVPETTCDFTAMGTLRLLEILRDISPQPRLLNVGSSELFGHPAEIPQTENTPFRPITPYGVAKTFAVDIVRVYRESFGMFACNAICYNHESPRRGESFVTRKITRAVAKIARGSQQRLILGNIDAKRDWGFAGDYVDAMWRMLQCSQPDDFILATSRLTSVREFLELAFGHAGLQWQDHVVIDKKLLRPNDPRELVGDASKAQQLLNWVPQTTLPELVSMMVEYDLSHVD
jgi:GDPmannose 4,6-dehydratase